PSPVFLRRGRLARALLAPAVSAADVPGIPYATVSEAGTGFDEHRGRVPPISPFCARPCAPRGQAALFFAASWARLLRSFAVKPVALSRNALNALIVSVATLSGTPLFIVVSTKSFLPSVQATILSRAPYDTVTFEPSTPASPNISAAIRRKPSPSRDFPAPRFSS